MFARRVWGSPRFSRPGRVAPGLVALDVQYAELAWPTSARIDSLANDMNAAAQHGHWRQVWRVGRAIARTGLGPKRRVYRPPDTEPISAAEWDAYMQQAFFWQSQCLSAC